MQQNRNKKRLDQYRAEISACVRCGTCKAVCPTYRHEQQESYSARGRMVLIQAVLNGTLPITEIFKDRLATCVGCLACEASCPRGVPIPEIIQAAKEHAMRELGPGAVNRVLAGIINHDLLMRGCAFVAPMVLQYLNDPPDKSGRMANRPSFARPFLETVPELVPSEADTFGAKRSRVAFFSGCTANYVQQAIARATVSVLSHCGYDVLIAKEQQCCGRPFLSIGDRETATRHAEHNARLFASLGVDAVVTACASCGLTFKKEYPKLLPPDTVHPPILDIHELLYRHLAQVRVGHLDARVTYHDPCHLGRGQGLSGTARHILQSIPGIELREMKNSDQCCGFGGLMRITHHELSSRIADSKARDIIGTGASLVATGCPACRMQIQNGLARAGSSIPVVHTVQIVERALGLEVRCMMHDAGYKKS